MTTHTVTFRDVDMDKFLEIKNGVKTIETRAATLKYREIKPSDTLVFTCGNETIAKTVARVDHFFSLDDMFAHLPLEDVLPAAQNILAAKSIYNSFPGYKQKIEKEGILAFTLV